MYSIYSISLLSYYVFFVGVVLSFFTCSFDEVCLMFDQWPWFRIASDSTSLSHRRSLLLRVLFFVVVKKTSYGYNMAIVVEDWYNLYNESKLLRFFIHFCLLLTTTQYQSVSDSLPYNRSFLILTLVGQFPRPRLWCDLQNTSTEHRF